MGEGVGLPWKSMCVVPIVVPVEFVSNQPNSLISVGLADKLRYRVAFNVCIPVPPDVVAVLVEVELSEIVFDLK